MSVQIALFETSLGPGGVAWGENGIVGIQLPELNAANIRASLKRRFPGAIESEPNHEVAAAIAEMQSLLRGEPCTLSAVRLDMQRVPEFAQQVYAVARTVRPGETVTYGGIAKRLGDPLLARDVGQALARNPFPIVVPCHRVLAAGGKLGGFSAAGGVETKQRLLAIERANVSWQPRLEV